MINFGALAGTGFLEALLVATLAAYSQYVVLRAGVFSMGTAGFMAIGAYAVAILTVKYRVPPAIAVIAGVLLASAIGLALGALLGRLRGAYQGIATISFVLVVERSIAVMEGFTGGPFGITGIPSFARYGVLLTVTVATIVGVILLELTATGRKQAAVRMDELAVASFGTNVAAANLAAMVASAAIGGLAGAMMAGNQFAIDPSGFSFNLVITTLAAVIIGGYRSFLGPLLGSVVSVALPLLFSKYEILASTIVAVVTILVLFFAPRGIAALMRIDSEWILRRLRAPLVGGARDISLPPVPSASGTERGLVAKDIARAYGAVRAVERVSLEVPPGRIVGLIGPNGAGKTSVINLLAGVLAVDRGTVTVAGARVETLPAYLVQRHGVARTFQACRLFREHSAWSNVLFAATCGRSRERRRELADREIAQAAMTLTGCAELADRQAGELAYAFQRRIEIARALACQPRFLLLDEPAAGMTAGEAAELGDILRAVAAKGVGVLVVDHNVPWILSLCEVVNVQHLGEIIASGPPSVIREDPQVIAAYIGGQTGETEVTLRHGGSPVTTHA
jgi:ABC-type branched-subunit amino acid transport system ATPase component/ABC-type branched-subunit amino acid transport system permease subunit